MARGNIVARGDKVGGTCTWSLGVFVGRMVTLGAKIAPTGAMCCVRGDRTRPCVAHSYHLCVLTWCICAEQGQVSAISAAKVAYSPVQPCRPQGGLCCPAPAFHYRLQLSVAPG